MCSRESSSSEKAGAPSPPPPPTATSQFALSFERVAVESLILPWHELELIHEKMREKRRLVEEHTTQAAEHLRSVALLNAELDSLEASFSAVMAAVVSERSRSQERLRSLVLEWERSHIQQSTDRSIEVQQQHAAEVDLLRKQLTSAQAEADAKQQRCDALSLRNQELQALMREYGLETTGPLVDALQGSRLLSPSTAAGKSSRKASLFLDPSAIGGADDQAIANAAYAKLSKETDQLRAEVLRLQADLSASKAESKVRRSEIEALRTAKEEWATITTAPLSAGEDHAFYRLQGGGGGGGRISTASTASGVPPYHTAASVVSSTRHSVTQSQSHQQQQQQYSSYHPQQHLSSSSSYIDNRGGAAAALASSTAKSPQYQTNPPQPNEQPAPSISVGLDLGTRRQHHGLSGVHIVGVLEGSPAWQAGIRPNDVLVGWAGHTIHQLEDVAAASRSLPKGLLALDVVVVRNVKPLEELHHHAGGGGGGSSANTITAQRTAMVSIPLDGRLNGPYNSRREPIITSQ